MKIFNSNSVCDKCAGNKAEAEWCPGQYRHYKLHGDDAGPPVCKRLQAMDLAKSTTIRSEHIHRRCGQCGYVWLELTVDNGTPLEQLASAAT